MFGVFVQVKSGTIFDNFLITDDVKEAEEFGKETWGATKVRLYLNTMCRAYYTLYCVLLTKQNKTIFLLPTQP